MNIDKNKKGHFLYTLICIFFLLANIVLFIVIAIELTEPNSFQYRFLALWTVISTIFYYWVMFKKKSKS